MTAAIAPFRQLSSRDTETWIDQSPEVDGGNLVRAYLPYFFLLLLQFL